MVLNIHQMSFIISEMGITGNYDEIMKALSLNVFEHENYEVKHDVGTFDKSDDQAEYIRLYIPADWTDLDMKS